MASQLTFYAKFLEYIGDGTINLKTDTIKLALVTSSYTPDIGHEILADVNSSPDPEVEQIASPDNGYTTGGESLSNVAWASTESPPQSMFDADDVEWTALDATFRYGIMYAAKSVGSPAIVNPLIGYILFNTAPADVVVSGVDYEVRFQTTGIFTMAQSV